VTGSEREEQKQQERSKNERGDKMLIRGGLGRARNGREGERKKGKKEGKMKEGYEIGRRRRAARKIT